MKCIRCGMERTIVGVSGKCDDRCVVEFEDKEVNGYVPYSIGIGGGDYITFHFCIACGQIQDTFPVTPYVEEEE